MNPTSQDSQPICLYRVQVIPWLCYTWYHKVLPRHLWFFFRVLDYSPDFLTKLQGQSEYRTSGEKNTLFSIEDIQHCVNYREMKLMHDTMKLRERVHFFLLSNLVARAHTIKCGEVECSGFEPRPLHKICIVPTNWVKLTGTRKTDIYW